MQWIAPFKERYRAQQQQADSREHARHNQGQESGKYQQPFK